MVSARWHYQFVVGTRSGSKRSPSVSLASRRTVAGWAANQERFEAQPFGELGLAEDDGGLGCEPPVPSGAIDAVAYRHSLGSRRPQ